MRSRFVAVAAAMLGILCASCPAPSGRRGERPADPSFVVAHSDGIVSRFDSLSVLLGSGRDASRLAGANPFS
ncbi:MAG: hypothetical protein CVV51_06380, partial [Spirochaetae bacterium HGW-Spirochaetae-7]